MRVGRPRIPGSDVTRAAEARQAGFPGAGVADGRSSLQGGGARCTPLPFVSSKPASRQLRAIRGADQECRLHHPDEAKHRTDQIQKDQGTRPEVAQAAAAARQSILPLAIENDTRPVRERDLEEQADPVRAQEQRLPHRS